MAGRVADAGANPVLRAGRRHDGPAPHGRQAAAEAEAGDRVHAAEVDKPRGAPKVGFLSNLIRKVRGKEKWPSLGGSGGYHRMSGNWPPPSAAAPAAVAAAPATAATSTVTSWYDSGKRLGGAAAPPPPKPAASSVVSWYDSGKRLSAPSMVASWYDSASGKRL